MTHIPAYALDDLLVNACREIIAHGMETSHLPQTIKDWIAGKILTSLPKNLVSKLLGFLLEDRDFNEYISCKENTFGNEFTILLYRSDADKNRKCNAYHWEQNLIQKGAIPSTGIYDDLSKNYKKENFVLFADEILGLKNQPDETREVENFIDKQAELKEVVECRNCSAIGNNLELGHKIGLKRDHSSILTSNSELDDLTEPIIKRPKRKMGRPRLSDDEHPGQAPPKTAAEKLFARLDAATDISPEERKAAEIEYAAQKVEIDKLIRKLDTDKYQCKSCRREFTQKSNLIQHIRITHKIGENPLAKLLKVDCRICKLKLADKYALYKHLKAKHKLEVTDENVDQKIDEFLEKMKTAGDSSEFVKNSLSDKDRVAKFEEVHYDAEADRYTCLVCSCSMKRARQILQHVETVHRGVKNHVCTWPGCGVAFGRAQSLKMHYLIHTEELPYTCEYCGNKFRRSDSMNSHKRRIHPDLFAQERINKRNEVMLAKQKKMAATGVS